MRVSLAHFETLERTVSSSSRLRFSKIVSGLISRDIGKQSKLDGYLVVGVEEVNEILGDVGDYERTPLKESSNDVYQNRLQ
jgi:hypothetical protein